MPNSCDHTVNAIKMAWSSLPNAGPITTESAGARLSVPKWQK